MHLFRQVVPAFLKRWPEHGREYIISGLYRNEESIFGVNSSFIHSFIQ